MRKHLLATLVTLWTAVRTHIAAKRRKAETEASWA